LNAAPSRMKNKKSNWPNSRKKRREQERRNRARRSLSENTKQTRTVTIQIYNNVGVWFIKPCIDAGFTEIGFDKSNPYNRLKICKSRILRQPAESCPYKSGKYLPIIGDFQGCRGIHAVSVPARLKFLFLKVKIAEKFIFRLIFYPFCIIL
jgi:hypothetical protein